MEIFFPASSPFFTLRWFKNPGIIHVTMLLLTPCDPGSGFPRSVSLPLSMCRRVCFWCCKTFQDSYRPSSSSSSIFIHPIYQRFSAGITTMQHLIIPSSRQLSFLSIGNNYFLHDFTSFLLVTSICCNPSFDLFFFLPFDYRYVVVIWAYPCRHLEPLLLYVYFWLYGYLTICNNILHQGPTIRVLVHCVLLRSSIVSLALFYSFPSFSWPMYWFS